MFWKLEDDLNFLLMEDDLNYFQMEDDLNILDNRGQPDFCSTEEQVTSGFIKVKLVSIDILDVEYVSLRARSLREKKRRRKVSFIKKYFPTFGESPGGTERLRERTPVRRNDIGKFSQLLNFSQQKFSETELNK